MQYKRMDDIDKEVSRIFFGTAGRPFQTGNANELLDGVAACGVNAFDTARVYGRSEETLGRWIAARDNREDIVLLSKCAHPEIPTGRKRVNEAEIRSDLETSLRLLQTDYIDIYLLHRDDPDLEAGRIVEWMNAICADGKIRAFGGSNWTHTRIAEANEYAYKNGLKPFTVSSPHFSLAEQIQDPWGGGCVTLTGEANAQARDWYQQNQMPVIAYASLCGGLLSGKLKSDHLEKVSEVLDVYGIKGYACEQNFEKLRRCEELAEKKGCSVSQIAMAWIYHQSLNTFAIVSASSTARMQENVGALDIALTVDEVRYLGTGL